MMYFPAPSPETLALQSFDAFDVAWREEATIRCGELIIRPRYIYRHDYFMAISTGKFPSLAVDNGNYHLSLADGSSNKAKIRELASIVGLHVGT